MMRTKKAPLIPWNQTENGRFLLLTASVFCLVLGGAVLLLALVERLFFELQFGKPIALVAVIALSLGGALLAYQWQKTR